MGCCGHATGGKTLLKMVVGWRGVLACWTWGVGCGGEVGGVEREVWGWGWRGVWGVGVIVSDMEGAG
jgi:hypothetical protein